ncbi:HU family DNA-binding protein [Gaoshiqia sp. Z1-71]|uniref:HU family DNA-binding protein n=1 Tax=Gaoshiqia hydrogeniformans TaxID=3290090 RepID=UPI003BF8DC54
MKYKLIERANPQDRDQKKWYASPVNEGKITKSDLAKDIVGASSLSRGDVSNAIENLIDTMPKYLLMGKSINLGEFGTLRISFSSEGVEAPEQFNTNKISRVKVIFTPSIEFKAALDRIKFEKGE